MVVAPEIAVPETVEDLVQVYCQNRDSKLRSDLIFRHLPLVETLARRFLFRAHGEPLEDLVQVGTIGLIKALDRFDPNKAAQFATYATHQIVGEIRHYLRDKSDLIRHPRWLRFVTYQMLQESERLAQQLGRFPGAREIADSLNITEESVVEILRLNETLSQTTLDGSERESLRRAQEKIRSQRLVSFQLPMEDKISLFNALEKLVEAERKAVYLFFYYDLTQSEIGKQLGLSQRAVSRLIQKALSKLKALLTSELW